MVGQSYSAEEDQNARMCRLILLNTIRKKIKEKNTPVVGNSMTSIKQSLQTIIYCNATKTGHLSLD